MLMKISFTAINSSWAFPICLSIICLLGNWKQLQWCCIFSEYVLFLFSAMTMLHL